MYGHALLHTEVCALFASQKYQRVRGYSHCVLSRFYKPIQICPQKRTLKGVNVPWRAHYLFASHFVYACVTQTKSKKKPKPKKRKKKKNGYKYVYTKSKITTQKKRITNKNMRGVLQFSVYSVVLSLCEFASVRLFSFFFYSFERLFMAQWLMPARMMPVQSGGYTMVHGAGVMFGYYVTQKWDKHISIWIEILN